MSTRKRRTYTPEYRREAARLVIDTGRTITAVAAEINVGAQLLGRWVQAERDRHGGPDAGLDVSERAESRRRTLPAGVFRGDRCGEGELHDRAYVSAVGG